MRIDTIAGMARAGWLALAGAAMMLGTAPAAAQSIQTIDPNTAIDGDLAYPPPASQPSNPSFPVTNDPVPGADYATPVGTEAAPYQYPSETPVAAPAVSGAPVEQAAGQAAAGNGKTYAEDDLIGAAEGVFGKGAEGVAKLIQGLLKDQGEPNGYIVGREAGGAFVVGVRYGSGTLYHKIEGTRPVYWTGPSIGFDAGANAGNTFVLVYNLYDSEELYKRFPAGEGQAYVVGGMTASYLRQGDVVLIPIRMGVGLRLGLNAGYMKFSRKQKWLPF